jgi:hypothetical protein
MPDEDKETRYYNERTGVEEWRRKNCGKAYATLGGTGICARHLIDDYGILRDFLREVAAKNI